MDEFTSVFGANPGSTFNANRNVNAGNLVYPGESWPLLLRQTNRLGAAGDSGGAGLSARADHVRHDQRLRSEHPGAAHAVLVGRPAARAVEGHGDGGPLHRHPPEWRVAERELERGQRHREWLPERVPARAGQPAGEPRRRPRIQLRLLRPEHRHRAVADLPRLLHRRVAGAGRRCRALWQCQLQQHHAPRRALPAQPDAAGGGAGADQRRDVQGQRRRGGSAGELLRDESQPEHHQCDQQREHQRRGRPEPLRRAAAGAAPAPLARLLAERQLHLQRQGELDPRHPPPRPPDGRIDGCHGAHPARLQTGVDLRVTGRAGARARQRPEPGVERHPRPLGDQRHGPRPERPAAVAAERAAGRHEREGAARRLPDPHRSRHPHRLHAAAGHHRQHRSAPSAPRRPRPAATARSARPPAATSRRPARRTASRSTPATATRRPTSS